MANWAFEIDRADNYIIDLTSSLTDEGFRIWCIPSVDDEFPPLYLFSSAYLKDAPADTVYVQASRLVKYIDGLSYLLFENKNNVPRIRFTNVIDKNTLRIANVPRTGTARAVNDFSAYKPAMEEDESPLSRLLKLVPADPFIRDLLLIVSQGMETETIAQAYDHIARFLDARGIPFTFPDKIPAFLTEIVFKILSSYYKIDLTPFEIKDQQMGSFDYDSIYD